MRLIRFTRLFASAAVLVCALPLGAAPEQNESVSKPSTWTFLLQRCVAPTGDGHSTVVDYGCFKENRGQLESYLANLSAVSRQTFEAWPRDERLAFLINAYNAWTVDLILSQWPDLESIRDLGSLLRSPWKRSFVPLLGDTLSLDDIEHGMIRAPGSYDDPRIHFAVNCASIGCPALRREAYTGAELEAQLEDQTRRFLADPSRNRIADDTLEVSSLFKWYRGDFENGWRDTADVRDFLGLYADALAPGDPILQSRIGSMKLNFQSYDWRLNQP